MILAAALLAMGTAPLFAQVRVNPLSWWVGMVDPHVQLMLYAPNIGTTDPVLEAYPGVTVTATHRVENKSYLFVDLSIAHGAKPGTLHFRFSGPARYRLDFTLDRKSSQDGITRVQGVTDKDLVYLLMPDRFANGDTTNDVIHGMRDTIVDVHAPSARHGGDLQGVQEHLDYLKDLGVTTVWMTPVVENDMPSFGRGGNIFSSYHGYAFTDQYHVDRRFGGNEAYSRLVEAAHAKGMKIIQDGVYNHIGSSHWTVLDPPMKDWLNQWPSYTQTSYKDQPLMDPHASQADIDKSVNGWFVKSMPDLNQRNPYVANYLKEYAIWATEHFGIDGWRVDTWFYSDADFLNNVNAALMREFPHLTMFGEVWVGSVAEAAYFCQNHLDVAYKPNLPGVVDFNVCFAMQDGVNSHNGAEKLYDVLAQDFLYKNPYRNCIMLDNHDMTRFFSTAGGNLDKYRMGMTWLLTLRGIPQLYYGDEVLMSGTTHPTDGLARQDFPGGWPGDTVNKFVASGRTAEEDSAFDWVRTLAHYRQHSTAVTTGKLMQYVPEHGVYVYFRYDAASTVMVVANTTSEDQKIDPARFGERTMGFTSGRDIETGETRSLNGEMTVPAGKTWVMELTR